MNQGSRYFIINAINELQDTSRALRSRPSRMQDDDLEISDRDRGSFSAGWEYESFSYVPGCAPSVGNPD